LLTAVSLFLPLLYGVGRLVLQLSPQVAEISGRTNQDRALLISLTLMLGVLCNYAIVLILENLHVTFIVSLVLAIAGTFLAVRNKGELFKMLHIGRIAWSFIIVITLLYAVQILSNPLSDWDARSIWFFHGKMIYYNQQTMDASAGWDQPFATFSLVGYPKLVPILAAQFATVAGYWNEYVPKAGLLALLIPALIGLFTFVRKPGGSGVFLIVMTLFLLNRWLWNGYVDGYLALYAGLACLYFSRWTIRSDKFDALAGFASLAMTASLKNEGMLLSLCVLSSLLLFLLLTRKSVRAFLTLFTSRTALILIIAFAGPIIWQMLKIHWELSSHMPSALLDIQLIILRLQQGAVGVIADALFLKAGVAKALAVLICSVAAIWIVKKRVPSVIWFPVITAVLYGTAMFWIYLTTNADLDWHLSTSIDRTMLPVIQMIVSASFMCLFEMEKETISNESSQKE